MDELRAGDPQRIGAYRLLGRLGAGGMGVVYLARSDRGRTVAVKLVRQELAEQDEFRGRFRQEVAAALQVGGAWTAPVLDADTEAAVPWVATGYIPGPSLRAVIGEQGPLPEYAVRVLAAGLAHALQDIHAAGLVHRDLKPSNVLITLDGPRVIDFGIARALETVTDGGITRTGAMVGSPGFMAPEQVRGERITPACDIFCLGTLLAYAASGTMPFGSGSGVHATLFRIAEEPPDLSKVPAGLQGLLTACLAKDPAQRPTPGQVLEAAGVPAQTYGEPWLPGGLMAQLGRHAVRLLEAENPETAEIPVVPDQRTGPGAPTGTAPGGRGNGRGTPGTGHGTPGTGHGTNPGTLPATASPTPTASVHAASRATHPATSPHASSPGIPVAGAPRAPRRRRAATGVLLAVALAVTALGGVTIYSRMHHSGTSGPPASVSRGEVPRKNLGTWEARFGASSTDVRRFTLRQGSPGDRVFTMTAEGASYHCEFAATLTSAGPPVELGRSEVTKGPAASCKPGPATTLELTRGGALRRTFSDDSAAPLTYRRVGR
ncbi:serine/threonine-protein kinase [Streptomyces sp. NPDC051776]|uniref:serine/threonine-protein kinase n=1 Tax=Streptomyces sp. NPDC051776 TaxID=3155414 RepID=UPI0034170F53